MCKWLLAPEVSASLAFRANLFFSFSLPLLPLSFLPSVVLSSLAPFFPSPPKRALEPHEYNMAIILGENYNDVNS